MRRLALPLVALGSCVVVTDDEDPCTAADNVCEDAWTITYCASGRLFTSDCQAACTTDFAVYQPVCGDPAVAGECDAAGATCACWCQDAFDSCVEGTERVRYLDQGQQYEVDCKDYCDGTCDEATAACACPS